MRILVVDDDPAIRKLLRLSIEPEGFQVLEAENGKDAETIQRETPSDVLICDLIMPVKEGMETISLFRNEYPEVGIIAISGGGSIKSDSYLQVARQLGAWRIYSKPLDVSQLIVALSEWEATRTGR